MKIQGSSQGEWLILNVKPFSKVLYPGSNYLIRYQFISKVTSLFRKFSTFSPEGWTDLEPRLIDTKTFTFWASLYLIEIQEFEEMLVKNNNLFFVTKNAPLCYKHPQIFNGISLLTSHNWIFCHLCNPLNNFWFYFYLKMESRGHRRSQSSSGKELTSKISNNDQILPVRHEVGIVQEKCKQITLGLNKFVYNLWLKVLKSSNATLSSSKLCISVFWFCLKYYVIHFASKLTNQEYQLQFNNTFLLMVFRFRSHSFAALLRHQYCRS